jgi:hypothetical protein
MSVPMYFLGYANSQRHINVKQIINKEEIKEYVDTFMEEYVRNRIMPKISSWLNALEAPYITNLPPTRFSAFITF